MGVIKGSFQKTSQKVGWVKANIVCRGEGVWRCHHKGCFHLTFNVSHAKREVEPTPPHVFPE